MLVVDVAVAVDDAGQPAADEWTHPVDPVAGEVTACNGGAKGAGRVHGAAGEWAGGQDVGTNDETNGDGGDGAQWALLGVDGSGVDSVDEGEGDDYLEHDALDGSDSGSDAVDGNSLHSINSEDYR